MFFAVFTTLARLSCIFSLNFVPKILFKKYEYYIFANMQTQIYLVCMIIQTKG
ncbi:hypothetical protein BA6E_103206 [Bacteroidales bacterium 6E]|nr:hypothetical protein BA6E_103206 [Bacteroidales bacterium 6E]